MNETTKYGLFFVGGVIVGALGAVARTRGQLAVKPLAPHLRRSGLDLRAKRLAGGAGGQAAVADVVEAEVKAQERKLEMEAKEAAAATAATETPAAPAAEEMKPAAA